MAKQDKKKTPKKYANKADLMKDLIKDYGDGSVMLGRSGIVDCESIPTGASTLDYALGVMGVPKGRIVEIYGPESSGKTTLTLSIIKQCQLGGGSAAFIDAEHALDVDWAANIGVDIENLIISQPDSGEQALELVERLCHSGQVDMIVVDSVAALTPQAEIDGEMGQSHVGLQARLMSQACRKLNSVTKKNGVIVIFINQIREKIGVMFGNPETTPGGRALKFYSSVRMEIRRAKAIKSGNDHVGNDTKVKVVKNKVAPPFKTAEFSIYFGDDGVYGVDEASATLNLALDMGFVDKNGSWYAVDGEKIGNGFDKACARVREDFDLQEALKAKIKGKADETFSKVEKQEDEPEPQDLDDVLEDLEEEDADDDT